MTKEKGCAGYEASTHVLTREVSEKYLSEIHRPLEHRSRHSKFYVTTAFVQVVVAESYTVAMRIPTLSCPDLLYTFQISSYEN